MNAVNNAAFGVWNGYAPASGPKALPYRFDFTTEAIIRDDFLSLNVLGVLQFVQTIYVDNQRNPNPFTIIFGVTNQRLVVPALTQGFYAVMAPDQTTFVASTTPGVGVLVDVIFMNVPMPISQWGPISVTANVSPVFVGDFEDRSGTVAVGGTSQQLAAANANRRGLIVQNPTSQLGSIWINFGAAAAADLTSIEIAPGGQWQSGSYVTTQAVNIVAADTGHVFIAKEI